MYRVGCTSAPNGRCESVLPLGEQIHLVNRSIGCGPKEYSFRYVPRYRYNRFRKLERRKKCLGGQIPDFDRMVERRRQDPICRKNTKGARDIRDG
jgi:hypothetical protein